MSALGERWSLLVIGALLDGPKRFQQLRLELPAISANILASRLRLLAARGILHRTKLPPPANVGAYELRPVGLACAPIVEALERWAETAWRSPPDLGEAEKD